MENKLFEYIEQYMSLTAEEKEVMRSYDIFRSYKKGTILLKEGQCSEESFFVLKGCLRTYYVIEGEEKTTDFYTEMEGLSPTCVLTKEPSEYFVACVEDSIVSVGTPGMEAEAFAKFPRFETLCRVINEQLLVKNQRTFNDFKTSSPEKRYLNLLQNRPDLVQRVPQHQLASYLGITPQSLSRMRARIMEKSK